jgi:hypothetical protein
MIKCEKCGFEGDRSDFRRFYVSDNGSRTTRRCPECGAEVQCDELELDEEMGFTANKTWGLTGVWGQTFPGKKKRRGK